MRCPECEGRGWVMFMENVCLECGGSGWTYCCDGKSDEPPPEAETPLD